MSAFGILEEAQKTLAPGQHVLCAMSPKDGDVKVVWNSDNEDEVATARKTFDDLKAKRFAAFRVDKKGGKATQMSTFDPDAEAIIMAPPIAGG